MDSKEKGLANDCSICSRCGRKGSSNFSYQKTTREWDEVRSSQVTKVTEEKYFECWGKQSLTQVDIFRMEEEAIIYVEDLFKKLNVIPGGEKRALGTKKEWREGAIKYLLKRPLIFVISVLVEWERRKSAKWTLDFAQFALLKLQEYLLTLFESDEVSEREKQVFKSKVFESFSTSELAKKLKAEEEN